MEKVWVLFALLLIEAAPPYSGYQGPAGVTSHS